MKENFITASYSLIFSLIILAAVSIPLFFLPTTTEFFEFNKFTLLLGITIIGYLVWCARMILEKKVVFTRTPLDIPLIVLLTVFFIASFASVDQFISFVANPAKIWPSFFALATITAFYFLVVSNIRTKKEGTMILWAVMASTAFASLIALTSYFGLFLPFEFAKLRSFNTLGIINRLATLQALVIPISISWAILEKDKVSRSITIVLALVMILSFVLINLLPAYIGLAVALAFLALGTLRVKLDKNQQGAASIIAVCFVLFLVIRYVPQVAKGTLYAWIANKDPQATENQQIDTPKEIMLPFSASWDVAAQAIGKRPLFGTGPGTFSFAYTQLKPRYMNGTDNWAVRFDKASSDFMETISTGGIFGVLAFLLFIISVARFVWTLITKSQYVNFYLPVGAASIGYIVANFATVSSFATMFVFFLGLATIAVFAKATDESHVFEVTMELATLKNRFAWFPLGQPNEPVIKTEVGNKGTKSQILPIIFTILLLIIAYLALNYQQQAYRAEYYYRQSLLARRSNDGNRTVTFIQQALSANPRIDNYHRDLSQTALAAAINLSTKRDLNDQEKQILGNLAQVAVDQGKVASGYQILPLRLPGISSANVANWETVSNAYQALIGSVQGADVHATNTLAQAVALDPENPILHDRLGQLYERLSNQDLAKRKYEDATIVKGDYGVAHYHLAKLLITQKGDIPTIVNELAAAKRFLPANDPALPDIAKNLDDYNKQLQELQQKAASQNQQAQPSPTPGASPEPSPSPSPSPKASGSPSPSPSL